MRAGPPSSSPGPLAPALPTLGESWCHVPWPGRRGSQLCPRHPVSGLCPPCRAWPGDRQHAGREGWGHCHLLHPLATFWSPEGKGKSICVGRVAGQREPGLGQHLCPAPWGSILPLCPSPRGRGVQAPTSAHGLGAAGPDTVSPLFLQLLGPEGAVGGHAAWVSRGDAPSWPGEHSSPALQTRQKRRPGAHPALSLCLPAPQDTRRAQETSSHPCAVTQTPGEGAKPPLCREYLSAPGSVPEQWSSSRAAEASPLIFFPSFSLAQWRTFSARSLERLVERQARVRMAAFHPPLAVPGCQGCGARRGSLCRGEGESIPRCLLGTGGGRGATRNTGMASPVALVLSAAAFLQTDAKQGPPAAESSNGEGLCRSPGEFWNKRPPPASS